MRRCRCYHVYVPFPGRAFLTTIHSLTRGLLLQRPGIPPATTITTIMIVTTGATARRGSTSTVHQHIRLKP